MAANFNFVYWVTTLRGKENACDKVMITGLAAAAGLRVSLDDDKTPVISKTFGSAQTSRASSIVSSHDNSGPPSQVSSTPATPTRVRTVDQPRQQATPRVTRSSAQAPSTPGNTASHDDGDTPEKTITASVKKRTQELSGIQNLALKTPDPKRGVNTPTRR